MKLISYFIISVAILGAIVSNAQQKNDQTLLTVGDEKIPASEFVRIYLKNNSAANAIDSKSIEEYLNLFVNFKLKVVDALNSGLDTTSSFKSELAGFRKQLARPYMVDRETEQRLIGEAYERMKYDVSASHILIAVPVQATPADTVKLYEKALAIRSRIINGEPFEVVARATSDDHSVTKNNGLIGYFTVFQMVYPFESAVYNMKVSEISMPVRTSFGYHIIKLHDKRLARGEVKVAHIMIAVSKDATPEQQLQAKAKIQEIYKQVLNNEDFGALANQFSQDPGSSKNNGELPWFGNGKTVPEFERVAFVLERDGQVSEPFQTIYGWHIMKRLGRKEIGTLDEMLPEIKQRLSSDMRNVMSIERMIAKIKDENGFKEDTLNLFSMVSLIDSSIYVGKWKLPTLKENKVIFTIADQKHDQSEFAKFLSQYQQKPVFGTFHSIAEKAYDDWVNQSVYDYQELVLDQKYSDFKYLMQEYHDGILLFNISDIKVWSKASNDSLGLDKFYQDKKENYRWGERVHYAVYSCADDQQLAKVNKMVASRKSKGLKPEDVLAKINKGKGLPVTLGYQVANPDEKEVVDYKMWVGGISEPTAKDGKIFFKELIQVTAGDIKALTDCKGQAISDYQQSLEEDWLKALRQKYPVAISQDVLKQVVDSIVKK
jgi:peptidyl-prolyl cis-trans isomerase SurA